MGSFERWLDGILEDERTAAVYHLILAGFAVLGVVYHGLWAFRRHFNHLKAISDPHQVPWLRRHNK